jgi:hypothetical protein
MEIQAFTPVEILTEVFSNHCLGESGVDSQNLRHFVRLLRH